MEETKENNSIFRLNCVTIKHPQPQPAIIVINFFHFFSFQHIIIALSFCHGIDHVVQSVEICAIDWANSLEEIPLFIHLFLDFKSIMLQYKAHIYVRWYSSRYKIRLSAYSQESTWRSTSSGWPSHSSSLPYVTHNKIEQFKIFIFSR